MSIFNIFKRKEGYKLPEIYMGIVTQKEYNSILDLALIYHKKNNLPVSKIDDGEIVIEINEGVQHRYLDNLVRVLSNNDQSIWKKLIDEHFDKLKYNNSAFDYLYKDYEYASQFLRVMIKGNSENLGFQISDYVHRVDFPQTCTFLVLEFENQFHYVSKISIAEWEKNESELFKNAIENIPLEEIEVKEYEFQKDFNVYTFISGDYSASLMLDLSTKAKYAIGKFGSLIAIPTKGTATVFPIETNNVLEFINRINPTVEKLYNEDPGNISLNYYWLYQNEFHLFPTRTFTNNQSIDLPKKLIDLLI